jgi:hypothetical protein
MAGALAPNIRQGSSVDEAAKMLSPVPAG